VAHVATDALSDPLRRRIVAKRDRYERAVRALVAAGIESGEFADGDIPVLTRAMLGALNWTVTWFRPEGERTAAAGDETLAACLIRGLSARPALRRVRTS